MHIQIASDLHLEILHQSFPGYNPIEFSDADVLVLAGDIAKGADAIEHFERWPLPVNRTCNVRIANETTGGLHPQMK